MISWADMTTLLWACFVLLWSFSTLDLVKFQKAASSLHGAFGVLEGGAMVLEPGDIPSSQRSDALNPAGKAEMDKIRKRIRDTAESSGYGGSIETAIDARGLMIRFADTALFDPGSTELKPGVIPVLDSIAVELSRISNNVQVEGHTDSTPINTVQFPSNWELSTGRAAEIVHYMIEIGGIVPERMSAAGYAFYHPVAPNSTGEGRARNRRVDIIVLNSPEQNDAQDHQDALSFLESDESTGIIMGTTDGTSVSTAGSGEDSTESSSGP
jgi:chemotaxis protein MotB